MEKVNAKAVILWFVLLFPASAIADAPLQLMAWQDGQLQLSDGRTVTLAGIVPLQTTRLPTHWRNTTVTAECLPDTDRYNQQACWIRRSKDNALLQETLLKSGKAMLYSAVPLPEMAALASAENIAPETALKVTAKPNRWALVEGVVQDVAMLKNATYLNFGADWKTDFTIYLPKASLKTFAPEALQALKGKKLRVRGWLHSYYGPRITLFNPQMMETLP